MNENFSLTRIIRKNVSDLQPYSSARDEFKELGTDMIFLDANENPFETGINRYPDPQQRSVKTALAELKQVSAAQILLGNGSDEVLDLLFRAFCEPNVDNVITVPPTYGMYKVLAGINAVENIEVLLSTDFQLNVTEILKKQNSGSKLLFLCSPNNPTGNSFSEEQVEQLLNQFNGIVVIDEAYIDFSTNASWLQKLSDFPNLVITQTMSKAFGMAGIRLGICYASMEIIEVLNKIKPPYNVNQLTQHMTLKRLDSMGDVKSETNIIREAKNILSTVLLQVKFVKKIYPSDANFLLAKVDNAALRYQQLIDMGVVVRNRSNQPLCENTLRFTVGTPAENLKLIQILNNLEE